MGDYGFEGAGDFGGTDFPYYSFQELQDMFFAKNPPAPYRRICLFGGPCSGKSTKMHYLCYKLKSMDVSVEAAVEVAKEYAYEDRPISGDLQLEVFGRQIMEERKYLSRGVSYIVSDSPLILQVMYTKNRNELIWKSLLEQALFFDSIHPSLNIFLDRTNIPFNPYGRYQKTVEEARAVDDFMITFLDEAKIKYTVLPSVDEIGLLAHVVKSLNLKVS